jgi:Leucine-rich repeat (LRR) protein
LHKPTGAIYNIDLDSLGLLYFDSSQSIETLDDLKGCEFLQVLRVVGDRNPYWSYREGTENVPPAQVLDISSLETLVYLKQLEISATWITDISPLSSLMNLLKLDLPCNQISDISALALLGKLTELDLSNNEITDISALENLKQLRRLNLSYNEITDISVLLQLPELREVAMQGNPLYRGTAEWDPETDEVVHTESAEAAVVEVLRERGVHVSWVFW